MQTSTSTATLTLAESAELERAVDGPITEQMVADKIAQRGRKPSLPRETVVTPEQHQNCIDACRLLLRKATTKARRLSQRITRLQAARDDQPDGLLKDIQTREIARVVEQYDAATGDVQRYSRAIADSEAALNLNMKQAAE